MADETSPYDPRENLTRVHGQEVGVRRARTLPYFIVLDTSGSMAGIKLAQANAAVREIGPLLADREGELRVLFDVRLLSVGGQARWVVETPTRPNDFDPPEQTAGGRTPLGAAFDLLAVEMGQLAARQAEHRDVLTPAILVISDGQPTDDDWESPLARLLETMPGRASKRGALAIGDDCDREMLRAFTGSAASVREVTDLYAIAAEIRAATLYLTRAAAGAPAVGRATPSAPSETNSSGDFLTRWVAGFEN